MADMHSKTEAPDISDRIFEIEDTPNEYFIDLSVDAPEAVELAEDNMHSLSMKREDKLILDILTEATRAKTLEELYQVIVFSTLGQTSSSVGAVIVPSASIAEKWRIAEYHGFRLKNANISFRQKDDIFRRVVEDNEIVDISRYEKQTQNVTEYNKFRSLQAQLLVPFSVDKQVKFVLLLGAKITGVAFSGKDYGFLKVLHQLIEALYSSIDERDQLRETVKTVTERGERIKHLENTLEKIRREQSRQKYIELIEDQMKFSGVNAYAFFRLDEISGVFTLLFSEQKDALSLRRSSFQIDPDSSLVTYFSTVQGHGVIENPVSNELLASVFDTAFLTNINMFAFVPYYLADRVCGFLICLRVDYELFLRNTEIIERLTRNVLQHEFARQSLVYRSQSVDTLEALFARTLREISECSRLSIPVGVIRYVVAKRDTLPLDAAEVMKIASGYLAKNEYTFRSGTDTFLAVFPGRKRSYVVKAARIIKKMYSASGYESELVVYYAETAAQYSSLVTKLL